MMESDLVPLDELLYEEEPESDVLGPGAEHSVSRHAQCDRRPRNWWSFILCTSISNRNNTQELDSETRDRRTRAESDKQEQKNKSDSEGTIRERNNPRKNNFSTNPGNFSEHYIFLTQNRGYVLNTRTPSLI